MVDLNRANTYFANHVLHNEEWLITDDLTRQRALLSAETQLYRVFRNYQPEKRHLPEEAVFEQALWLLRMDESVRKSEQGVKAVSVSGLSITMEGIRRISPEVIAILGRRVGRYTD
ncbi:hypothetical protein GJ688_19325 [Heliobacillus mobilis]|uniref:Uncharacterized protein n=1 Tax=Heliobacterium mobile TaxID=28064 RepID=A0A6I3SRR0_HELMO|nr:hypothetical protein [Heliobacterium mobile]MTV51052.1 hypothetical protein [Heliobacterium mobile]